MKHLKGLCYAFDNKAFTSTAYAALTATAEHYRLYFAEKICNAIVQFIVENFLVFELQSIQIINCNLVICLFESKYLKMTKVIWIIQL